MNLNNELSFEKALQELKDIVDRMESKDLTLEESFENFKRGVELYKYCFDILNKVEGDVKVLLKDDKGNILENDFYLED
ncbi:MULTISPECIES: exodeoxyribonuclease VII small subunit [Tissierellales]|jgi:exodeoxyribonuclease VII small subunit|uniref:Exodeoxyribonuclease 7 small subunit n=1 Tax=Acidilutibacter cellobiosedens TaxID=2507161 RepID=A0A410QCH0_9FIRM|nr:MULTISPECIES: exodeoxyribonuclease VII small subunit [Tissierellales]MBE6082599.1 exodeoxyribonuclease VII small subunit [Tissierellaceae bacterium]QAT61762.1 exodeoxyribonuclease VII small subunit [Acidilutibacter cellobiosedens]SCL82358.1 Exodeoxyribonuclease 7 small subunit [Sporanaerobacter sp. PP17-6a]